MKLIIFDLDQTLVDFISIHDLATCELFRKHFGVEARLTEIDFAGKSLINNFTELASLKGIPTDSIKKHSLELLGDYEKIFGRLIPENAYNSILPGARELLEALSKMDNIIALYTGDSRGIVNHVFRVTGLGQYFHLAVYAEEARNRIEMVRTAIARAEKIAGKKFENKNIVIIGDSARDIDAGRAFNALTIAVATGFHTEEELKRRNPDCLFDNLADEQKIIKAIGQER